VVEVCRKASISGQVDMCSSMGGDFA
jgi:hypothetical protein